MTHLIQIGNSQGLRIPKPLIKQARLDGKELVFELLEGGGLIIRPVEKVREGWEEKIQSILKEKGDESIDMEWLDANLIENDWIWE